MAVWSTVSLSQLEYSRIDAEFYKPTYLGELQSWQKVNMQIGVSKLGELLERPVRTGRTPKFRRVKKDEKCIRFIKTDTVREGSIDFGNSAFLPIRVVSERDFIPENAIVITIIGATPEIVGRAAIIRPTDPACVTNQNVAVICTSRKCDPYFLTAYFQTSWGRDQILRHSRRTEQVNLNCREVERVLVPNPPQAIQEEIGNLVRDSFASSDQGRSLIHEAQQLLALELGFDNLAPQKTLSYLSLSSDVVKSRRTDAEYYNPAAREILKRITALQHTMLAESFDVKSGFPWNSAKFLPDNSGEPVVRIRNVKPNYIIPNELTSIEPTYANTIGAIKAHKGDVVVGMDGIKYFYASLLEGPCYVNQRVCHLSPQPSGAVSPEYATFIINSFIGQAQLMRDMTVATTVGHITNRNIAKLVIPTISPAFHDKITALVRQSIDSKEESKRLLALAKSRVEQLIEEAVEL